MEEHLENATVFKGTSKTVQNELLDCMLSVNQLVLVLRHTDDRNTVQERFFEFIPLKSANAESIATALSERLSGILPEQKGKLICQVYDGASVMRGAISGVERRIQDEYPNAHYIHCYAHN
ncbi:hypothetical protein N1851_031417 [Merluccius polli]|uniref:DUF4371 domain-containing protein n=1 Tax=Merluccius polli TaxID=89951 RepID=A0AA47M3W1_MERPO|nr:hypothetical protein N1851_031417 [Merluccius polli]